MMKLLAPLAAAAACFLAADANAALLALNATGTATGFSDRGIFGPPGSDFIAAPFTFDGYFRTDISDGTYCSALSCAVEKYAGGLRSLFGTASTNGGEFFFGERYSYAYSEREADATRFVFLMSSVLPGSIDDPQFLHERIQIRFLIRRPGFDVPVDFSKLGFDGNLCSDALVCEAEVSEEFELRPYTVKINLDSFVITQLSAAPEPSSWALMLAGFGAVGAALRHRRRPQPA